MALIDAFLRLINFNFDVYYFVYCEDVFIFLFFIRGGGWKRKEERSEYL